MKILLLCEPRSGSTQLARWFFSHKIDTRFETTSRYGGWYLPDGINGIKYDTNKDLVLKELYRTDWNSISEYINFCDKVIFLFRENTEEQIISYDYGIRNDVWYNFYAIEEGYKPLDSSIKYIEKLKKNFNLFRQNYSNNTLSISYEDLYQRNKINKVIDFLNMEDKLTLDFPTGQKLRINKDYKPSLI